MADLRDEDELEWDSEEYHDVEAIIIAESFVKLSTVSIDDTPSTTTVSSSWAAMVSSECARVSL